MKFYKVDTLFISKAGTTYLTNENGNTYKNLNSKGYGIFKKDKYDSTGYIEIFSNVEYINFHSSLCRAGELAVNMPTSLTIFIQKYFDNFKNSKLQKIANKIVNGKSISDTELKDLLFVLNNNGELEKKSSKKTNIKIYTDLYKKKYSLHPCTSREQETKELITLLASKENPILVGDHGVGKTTIIEGLVYNIQVNKIPNFLKNQKIIKLDIANLIACKECAIEKLIELIAYCIKKDIILFVDDIDKIIDLKLDSIIIESINNKNLKVIATTTLEKYNQYFLNSNLTKLYIDEPTHEELNAIIINKINSQITTNNLQLLNYLEIIVDLLIELTKISNRKLDTNNKIENEKNANPYLVTQIINTIIGHAIANNQTELSIENIIYAITACDKIEDEAKEKCITNIKKI